MITEGIRARNFAIGSPGALTQSTVAPAAKAPTIEGIDVEGDLAASENPKPVACWTSAACDLKIAIVKLVIEQIVCDSFEVTIDLH